MSSTKIKTIYADTDYGRLGAKHLDKDTVLVWPVGDTDSAWRVGIDMIEEDKLTARTLKDSFTNPEWLASTLQAPSAPSPQQVHRELFAFTARIVQELTENFKIAHDVISDLPAELSEFAELQESHAKLGMFA